MPVRVADPPGYPREWEADVLLSDGSLAHLRPIRPDDARRLVKFYDRVSPESKFLRFFAPYPRLSDRDVARFTQVDYVDRVAFILLVGERLIAVGRYDRVDGDEAEVAFLVEDAYQGRGVAQLLLEHLAEAARERGIRRFVAEVLPQNRRMAAVFADAGYRVSKGMSDGVLSVEFPILPTNTSVGVMERREHRAERAAIQRLLTPERVLVLGQGERVQRLVQAVLAGGFTGEVIVVCPDDRPPPPGVTCASSAAAVDGQVDLALVSVPTTDMGSVVIDVAHKRASAIVVLTGTDLHLADNRTVVNLARAYGVRALGPDALGLINTDPAVSLNATPGPMPRHGTVGLFCQSAAVGVVLLNEALHRDTGLSSFLSTGDYADVTGNDVMQFWEDDEHTSVCLLSLDTIGNPRKFSRITRRLTRRKPVVVFAPGRTNRASHLGVRGGLDHAPEAAVDALFRQAGVMVVHRRAAMFDIAELTTRQPLPAGPRVRLVSNSVTLAAQMRQSAEAVGLLPGSDPGVLSTSAGPDDVVSAVTDALADPQCDSVVCAVVRVFDAGTGAVRAALEQVAATSSKPLLGALLDFSPSSTRSAPALGQGLPVFAGPSDALSALAAVSAYAHWRERDPGAVPLLEVDSAAAHRIVNRVLAREPKGRELDEAETAELLGAYGITVVPRFAVRSLAEATEVAGRLGGNVVLKATAEEVRGRPDLASVYRNLHDADELADAWEDLGQLVAELGLSDRGDASVAQPVVQAMAPAGVALLIGSREDAAFGPMVSLGLDGIASELLGDVVYRVPPLTTSDAAGMVRDLRAAPVLFGRNGSPGVDVQAVQDLVHRVAQLADDHPQLASVSLRPVVASLSRVAVLGARVLIAPTDQQRDALARAV